MPKDYGGGPGLKTGSSWGGTMASGNAGGMAQAYGTRGANGSVSWNGINGNPSYTGYGDYYSAGIPRQTAAAYQGPVKPVTYRPKPIPAVQRPPVNNVQPTASLPASKFYGFNYGPQYPNMLTSRDYQVPGGYGITAFSGFGGSQPHQGVAGPYSGPDPYGNRYAGNPARNDYRAPNGWSGGGFGGGRGGGY